MIHFLYMSKHRLYLYIINFCKPAQCINYNYSFTDNIHIILIYCMWLHGIYKITAICGISLIFIHYLQRFHHLVIPSGWIVFCIVFHANFVLYFVSCFVSLFVSDFVSLFVSFFLYVTYVQKLSRTRNGFDPVSHSFISAIQWICSGFAMNFVMSLLTRFFFFF